MRANAAVKVGDMAGKAVWRALAAAWLSAVVAAGGCGTDDAVEGGEPTKTDSGFDVGGIDTQIGGDGLADAPQAEVGEVQGDSAADSVPDAAGDDVPPPDGTGPADAADGDVQPDVPACDPAQCDDKNPCTKDECQAGKCASVPADGPCDDADPCTVGDACKDGKCLPGNPTACDDANPCTDDKCDKASGKCAFTPNQAPCNDQDDCTSDDTCLGGQCNGKFTCKCKDAATCDDGNPCTADTCAKGNCAYADVPGAVTCSDANVCTVDDACKASACLPGAVTKCDDENPCTADTCDPKAGCVFAPVPGGTVCENEACDGIQHQAAGTCLQGTCVAGQKTNCDDANPCTDDACDAKSGCKKADNAKPCDDNTVCTVGDTCKGGACLPGAATVCDDKNPCTVDSCDPVKGCGTKNVGDGAACQDPECAGLVFAPGAVCMAGACTPTGAPVPCDDKNPCTDDACSATAGCSHKDNSAPCDDGDACTSGDVCFAGGCTAQKQVACDDKNPCTDDACDKKLGCTAPNNSKPCDDGSVCTKDDACADGKCQPGKAIACDDKNPCTDDGCDPQVGCTFNDNTAKCDDGNACNSNDVCDGGKCAGAGGKDCSDGNPCTLDTCDTQGGCVNKNLADGAECAVAACAAGSFTGPALCKAGTCGAKPEPVSCDDQNPCTTDLCNPAQGCSHADNSLPCDDANACSENDTCGNGKCAGSKVNCDDDNPCTDTGCDPKTGCNAKANSALCSDSNACTNPDKCADKACMPGPKVDCDDKNVCTTDSCDALKGCVHVNNAATCNDGDACTKGDVCVQGACTGPNPVVCNDGNVCTNDACDPKSGCVLTANAAKCDDGNACTTLDKCKDELCIGGPKPDCDDGNVCSDDACDVVKGCVHTNNSKGCDDSNACTLTDTCKSGTCVGSVAPVCDDKNPCTSDACDSLKGCIAPPNTNACDDGSVCTKNDTCKDSKCLPGQPISCDDGNVCTNDSCDATKGCQYAFNTISCDDGNGCNTGDTCNVGKCAGTGGKNCDDGNPCTVDGCTASDGCTYKNVADGSKCTDPGCVGNDYQAPATCTAGKCGSKPALQSCDDKNVCTNDLCNAAQGCLHNNNTAPCDDGNKCTQTDTCSGGGCNGQLIACDDKNGCTDDSCDPATGCVFKANTAPCDDGDACTTKDTCAASACKGGAAANCDDGNGCTTDGCDKAKGCTAVFNTNPCDDSSKCTTNDACASGKCVGGPPPVCDDKNVCTNDSCDPAQGCVVANNTNACEDGDACTTNDKCAGGKCVGGVAPNCDDKNVCTSDSCDKAKGCLNAPVTDGTKCIDGSCNSLVWQPASTCQAGKCTTPATQNCDDALECTVDACAGTNGCSHTNKAWGTACTPANVALKWPFCAGSLCTGYEIAVQQPNSASRSLLTGITRTDGKVFASGADNSSDTGSSQLKVGTMSRLTSSPLASQHNMSLAKSQMRRVANLMAVGPSTDADAPRVMTYDASSGFWNNNGTLAGGLGNRRLLAVATYAVPNKDWYAVTAEPGGTSGFLTNLFRVPWTSGAGFGTPARMFFSTKPTTCGTQVEATLHDIYPASASAVYFVGTAPKAGGGFNSVVGFFDGNQTNTCGTTKFDGAVWTDNGANDLMVPVNTGASPAVGAFQAVHGQAAGDVLVAGEHGTVFSFDGGAWTQEQPNAQGLAWNSTHHVYGVWTAGTQAWATGVRLSTSGGVTCRAGFVLHGDKATGTWKWNKLVDMKGVIETCAFDANNTTRTDLTRAWVDATTGDVWFVGSQGTNSSGGIVQAFASQTRQLLVRVKTK